MLRVVHLTQTGRGLVGHILEGPSLIVSKPIFPTHEKVPLAACSMFQDPQKLKIGTLLHQSKLNICSSSSSKPEEPAEVLADAFVDAAGPRPKLQTTDGVKTTIEQALQAAVKKA